MLKEWSFGISDSEGLLHFFVELWNLVYGFYMLNTAYRDCLDCGMLRPQAKPSLLNISLHEHLA